MENKNNPNQKQLAGPSFFEISGKLGIYLGLYFLLKLSLLFFIKDVPFLALPWLILTLAVPFVVYWIIKQKAPKLSPNNPYPGFSIWQLSLFIVIFGSILASIGNYFFYTYAFPGLIQASLEKLNELQKNPATHDMINNLFGNLSESLQKPIDDNLSSPILMKILGNIQNNFMFAVFYSIPIALILRKRMK